LAELYCENAHISKGKPEIQCHRHQNLNDILHRNNKINKSKSSYDAQKTQNIQSNPEQKAMLEVSQYLTSNYTTEPQYSNKNTTVLA
jgi:hypothetical protein